MRLATWGRTPVALTSVALLAMAGCSDADIGGAGAGGPGNDGAVDGSGAVGAGASSSGAGGSDASGGTTGGAGANAGGTGGDGAGGTGGDTGDGGTGGNDMVLEDQVPGIVAVGYGGLRVVSRDNGKTWTDMAYVPGASGDDQDLLRSVTWGDGLWIAMGWKLWTSPDGVAWTDHGRINDEDYLPCNIVEGLAFRDGYYFAACSESVFRSTDGLEWSKWGDIGNTDGHLFMDYRGGKFFAYGDTKTSFVSDDAKTWTVLDGVSEVTYCADQLKSNAACFNASWFGGAYLRGKWKGIIQRSTTGSDFQDVYVDPNENGLYRARAMAAGYVAPE